MRKKIRTIAVLPTLFTLGNLVCGFFAIVVASRVERPLTDRIPPSPAGVVVAFDSNDPTHNIMLSGWLIFMGMVFDALDGHVARLARTSSDFGAELDSLCDVVTFGAAPGFLLVKMCPYLTFYHPEAIWVIAAALPVCAALRLARFNVETPADDDHLSFSGLPSPAAAGSIAGFAILFYTLRRDTSTVPNLQRGRFDHGSLGLPVRVGGGGFDGFASPVSAYCESDISRATQLRTHRQRGVCDDADRD